MSIRFGTSITRGRRAYDRRCRGARDGAMAATTAIPPRRDRKRTATHARATAGMQVRGANVQHSNARGRSATLRLRGRAQRGCPEGRDGTSLCRGAQASIVDNRPGYGENAPPSGAEPAEPTGATPRTSLNRAFMSRGFWDPADGARVLRVRPRRSFRRASRATPSSMEQPMEQPTTPAEQTPDQRPTERTGRSSPRPRPRSRAPLAAASSRAAPASAWRGSGARSTCVANVVALAAVPGVWMVYRDDAGLSQLHAVARDLGHARGRARHVRHPRPPLHPVAEPVRRRQVVPHRGHLAAPAHRVLALHLALLALLPDALRRHPVLHGRPARRSGELRRQHRLGDRPLRHVRRASGTAWPPADRAQLLFILMINLFIGAIFIVPMVLMAVRQMKSYEPGDASWGVEIDHVRGQADVKEEVRKIIELWQASDQFKESGGKPERGLLFIGPPGTGKTMLAKAIATGFNAPFMAVPGSGFAQTFIGMDVVAVQWMGHKAKKLARKWGGHCIVFIDEIDAVGMRRAALGGASSAARRCSRPRCRCSARAARARPPATSSSRRREWREYIGRQHGRRRAHAGARAARSARSRARSCRACSAAAGQRRAQPAAGRDGRRRQPAVPQAHGHALRQHARWMPRTSCRSASGRSGCACRGRSRATTRCSSSARPTCRSTCSTPRSRARDAWAARCSSASRTRSTAPTCSTSTWRRSRTRPTSTPRSAATSSRA